MFMVFSVAEYWRKQWALESQMWEMENKSSPLAICDNEKQMSGLIQWSHFLQIPTWLYYWMFWSPPHLLSSEYPLLRSIKISQWSPFPNGTRSHNTFSLMRPNRCLSEVHRLDQSSAMATSFVHSYFLNAGWVRKAGGTSSESENTATYEYPLGGLAGSHILRTSFLWWHPRNQPSDQLGAGRGAKQSLLALLWAVWG